MQLQLRDLNNDDRVKFDLSSGEEIMIYGFIVKIIHELNLLDFFERFKTYVEFNNLKVFDSFSFTKWLMEEERVAIQPEKLAGDVKTLRQFWDFQDSFLDSFR